MYLRARHHSTLIGRFISRDPIGYVDGMNLYAAYFLPNEADPDGTRVRIPGTTQALGSGGTPYQQEINCKHPHKCATVTVKGVMSARGGSEGGPSIGVDWAVMVTYADGKPECCCKAYHFRRYVKKGSTWRNDAREGGKAGPDEFTKTCPMKKDGRKIGDACVDVCGPRDHRAHPGTTIPWQFKVEVICKEGGEGDKAIRSGEKMATVMVNIQLTFSPDANKAKWRGSAAASPGG